MKSKVRTKQMWGVFFTDADEPFCLYERMREARDAWPGNAKIPGKVRRVTVSWPEPERGKHEAR